MSEKKSGQLVAIVAYITWVGFIVALLIHYIGDKKTQLGAYHLRQMLGIILGYLVGGILLKVPVLGTILGAVILVYFFVMLIMGLIYAIQGKEKPIPLVGEYFQKWFAFIQ